MAVFQNNFWVSVLENTFNGVITTVSLFYYYTCVEPQMFAFQPLVGNMLLLLTERKEENITINVDIPVFTNIIGRLSNIVQPPKTVLIWRIQLKT